MKRNIEILKTGWKFSKITEETPVQWDYDKCDWRSVTIPHDWAVEGPFDEENDKQKKEIIADGVLKPITLIGRTGGLPVSGEAWYITKIKTPDKDKSYFLEFDGVMSNGEIYVNGKKVYERPYGYISYSVDITDYIDNDNENTISVKTAPRPRASRFYPGAGIYREVRLLELPKTHVKYCGTYVVATVLEEGCEIKAHVEVEGETAGQIIKTTVKYPCGKVVFEKETICQKENTIKKVISDFTRWSIENPYIYTMVTEIILDGEVIDSYVTKFGIKEMSFDPDKGFKLNGVTTRLKGVCMHHDLGILGAAFDKSTMKRQIEVMQEMGCNSIRTSHNPPDPKMLDLCDEMGILVIDEAFDEWKYAKVDNGYASDFEKWGAIDLTDFIRRDRNHPSIIMWSTGNEILDQLYPDGADTARMLTEICHNEDPTRPSTAAFNHSDEAIKNGLAAEVDIVGFNYKPTRYVEYHKDHPDWVIYGSETESCTSSRGEYFFPVTFEYPVTMAEGVLQVNSFDTNGPGHANSPETEFAVQDDNEFLLGEYVWTGFDYLGEPTPFRGDWPSHSSYFGIVDLCGLKKDRFYSYKCQWTDEKEIHVFPHWNWTEGQEVEVHCYSNCDTVELFLNGESLGVKARNPEDELERYRFIWKNITYTAGNIKVVGYDVDGTPLKEETVYTAGAQSKVNLVAEKSEIEKGDMAFFVVSMVDENGIHCPKASTEIEFTVEGDGEFIGSTGGDATCLELLSSDVCRLFNGYCVAMVRGNGDFKLTATAHGFTSVSAEVKVK